MERSERITIAKEILDLIATGQPYYGEESWEGDIGRFVDKERFDLEKKKLFLERPQLIALTNDLPDVGDFANPFLITPLRLKVGNHEVFAIVGAILAGAALIQVLSRATPLGAEPKLQAA